MKGYEYLSAIFNAYGTTHMFFQEVSMNKTIHYAKEKYGIESILAHTEGAAGYMADGYARVTGKPGVVAAQSVGAANLVGGIQDASFAKVPVIALTGRKPASHQYKNAYQEADHRALYSGVTKFNAEINDPQELPFLVRQCYKQSVTGKPGPVHLDLQGFDGLDSEMSDINEEFCAEPVYGNYPPFRPSAEAPLIANAADLIGEAKKPLIVIGRGAYMSDAGEAIEKLAKKADIPFVTTPDGKTVVDESDEYWAGIVGQYGMDCGNKAAMAADLVIFIGTQASDQTTCDWNAPAHTTKVIQIDIEPSELCKNYPDSVGLPGDAAIVTGQLADAAAEKKNPEWRAEVKAMVEDTLNEQNAVKAIEGEPIRTEYLCKVVGDVLPDDAILVSDTGFGAIWSATMIRMKKSQSYIRAAGSLGWAYPASLGAKCGAPERPVVCFIGDGGFYYHLPEMETAMRNGINTVTVINNNSTYSQCTGCLTFGYSDAPEKGVEKITFETMNFAKVAEDFGVLGIRVEKSEDIAPAIEKALAAGRPAVVEVVTADAATCQPLPAIK